MAKKVRFTETPKAERRVYRYPQEEENDRPLRAVPGINAPRNSQWRRADDPRLAILAREAERQAEEDFREANSDELASFLAPIIVPTKKRRARANDEVGRVLPSQLTNRFTPMDRIEFRRFVENSDLRINGNPALYPDLATVGSADTISINGQNYSPDQINQQFGASAYPQFRTATPRAPRRAAPAQELAGEIAPWQTEQNPGVRMRTEGLGQDFELSANGQRINPQQSGEQPLFRTGAPGAPRGPGDNGRNPGRPGRPGGGPEEPGRPTGGPVTPEPAPRVPERPARAAATPPRTPNVPEAPAQQLPPGVKMRTEGLGPNDQLNINGQAVNPQQNNFLPPQLVNPVRPELPAAQQGAQGAPQLPTTQQAAQVPAAPQYNRPAGMNPNQRLGDIRNNDRGFGFTAPAAATGAALTIPTVLGTLKALSPAMATTLAHPATAPVAAALAGALIASPAMFYKIDQAVNNGRMDKSEARILELLRSPNLNSPEVQQQLAQERQKLANYAAKMHQLANQDPRVMEYINHLTGGVRATPDWAKGEPEQPGQPGQQGPMVTGANGEQIPQGSIAGGRPEMIHRVGLQTPEQQNLQNRDIAELMQNRASFEPIAQNEIRRFKEETLPYIAEQYFGKNPNSFGGAYPEALGRAGATLGERLSAAKAQYEANREDRLYRSAYNQAFAPLHLQRQEGLPESIIKRVGGSALELGGELAKEYGSQWIKNRFSGDQAQQKSTTQTKTTNYMPEPLSNINYNRKPSAQNIAQGAPDMQRALMEAAENKNYTLGGRRR